MTFPGARVGVGGTCLWVLVLVASCARSHRLDDDRVALDAFLRAFGEWECAQALRCGGVASTHRRLSVEGMDAAVAVGACYEEDLGWRLDATLAGARSGTVAYDARRAAACLAALPDAPSCADLRGERVVPAACESVFVGTVPSGDACAHDVECQPGHACRESGCPRVCVPFLPPGAPCTEGRCAPGHACAAGMCQPEGGVGARCAEDAECAGRIVCFDGRCAADATTGPRARGEPCDAERACSAGLACHLGECTDRLDEGEDCGAARQLCADGLTCATDGTAWACEPWAAFGDPCRSDADCLAVAGRCVESAGDDGRFLCARAPLEGEACSPAFARSPCIVGACVDGRCVVDREGPGTPRGGGCLVPTAPDDVPPCAPGLVCRPDRTAFRTDRGTCEPACDVPGP